MLGLLLAIMPAAARVVSVSIVDYSFQPSTADVNVGDSVKWTNNSAYYVHTSTSGVNGTPDGKWDSGNIDPGSSYTHGFSTSGTFDYFCRYHYAMGMTGSVAVSGTAIGGDSQGPAATRPSVGCSPNPFSTSTTIRLAARPHGRAATIGIYDVTGHLVRKLTVGYSTVWDGRDAAGRVVPAGIYHCVSGSTVLVLTKLS